MNTEELLQEINELKEQIQALSDIVSKDENEKAWKPSNGEQYYIIRQDFNISPQIWTNHPMDKQAYKAFNCFKTGKRAEHVANKLKMLLKLERYHDMFCPNYVPDWDNQTELKFLVYYDNYNKTWEWDYVHTRRCCTEIYFDSEESAQKVCNLLNSEEF